MPPGAISNAQGFDFRFGDFANGNSTASKPRKQTIDGDIAAEGSVQFEMRAQTRQLLNFGVQHVARESLFVDVAPRVPPASGCDPRWCRHGPAARGGKRP